MGSDPMLHFVAASDHVAGKDAFLALDDAPECVTPERRFGTRRQRRPARLYSAARNRASAQSSRHALPLVPDLTLVKTNANIVCYASNLVVLVEYTVGRIHYD